MLSRILLLVFLVFSGGALHADDSTDSQQLSREIGRYRISLLIGGPGEELWETFGHSCIRVIDSTRTDGQRDLIYNYGFFSAEKGSIGHQFLTGKVEVFLDTITYDELMYEYRIKKRSLTEQVFLLDDHQKAQVVAFLEKNLRNANRFYYYNTFFDNCTTRIRDMFATIFGNRFVPGPVLQNGSTLSFRDASFNRYCPQQNKNWFGLGLNIFYAGSIDNVMGNSETMCLPVYLGQSMDRATVDGKRLCADPTFIQREGISWTSGYNEPFLLFCVVALITIAGLVSRKLRILGTVASTTLTLLSGVLGCFILYTWWLDGEPAWRNNYNVLWALPTNIFLPFLKPAARAKYSIPAICLLGLSMLLYILRVQTFPLLELSPLLLSLLWIYCMGWRKSQP